MRRLMAAPAIGGFLAITLVAAGCGSSEPNVGTMQTKMVRWLHQNNVGAGSVVCNLPSKWTPGATFKCFVYNGHNKGLGTVNCTVLPPTKENLYEWNESFTGAG